MKDIIPIETIMSKIIIIRNEKVMLDKDLAKLYCVETKVLNQAIKRNIKRFPPDFMFKLIDEEFKNLRSQIVTSSWGGRRTPPYAFTEQGVAMLSSVLNSQRAIEVNIAIMRAFVKLRRMIESHKQLAVKLEKMEAKYDYQFKIVFEAIKELMSPLPKKPKRRIGF
ncbi:MAG: ORF6N domain-containing protein [Candidatus Cloacimonetes bacterium]|nr:ORF6N domain-containing protein [Candidatus Cloacimonadota bacterium]